MGRVLGGKVAMNILIYAVSGFNTIGGGRRVSAELTKAFTELGHRTLVWSLRPYKASELYGNSFTPDNHFFSPDGIMVNDLNAELRRKIAKDFLNVLATHGIGLVLFDCEFSYQEFKEVFGRYVRWPSDTVCAALIHDQLWNGRPHAMTIYPCGRDAKRMAAALPYTPIRLYYQMQRSHLIEVTGHDFTREGIGRTPWYKQTFAWRLAHYLKKTQGEYREIIRRKRQFRRLDVLFNLTERARRESLAAYGLPSHRVVCAFGVTDYTSHNIAPVRDFRVESESVRKTVILSFARMAPEKYLEITLLSFAQFLLTHPDGILWMGGQIVPNQLSYFEYIKAVVSHLGISDKVFFWGTCPEGEMLNLYQQCDCFICTDPVDFNLSVYTALKLHKPVVVGDSYDFPPELFHTKLIRRGSATVEGFAERLRAAVNEAELIDTETVAFLKQVNFHTYAQTILASMERFKTHNSL